MTVLDLPPTTDSVPVARRFVRSQLRDSPLDVDTAVLLVSELVTNVVPHARSPFSIRVEERVEVVRVEVRDGSPAPPRMHRFSATSATGRGLRLLDQLARSWGVDATPDGKCVWFEIGRPDEQAWSSFVDDDLLAQEGV